MRIRDRIRELRRVPAKSLLPNPKNWRKHPDQQANVLKGLLAELGFCDALLVRETGQGLMLLDGHLRAETAPEANVPVLILDVNEAEADKLLATLDNVTGLAEPDKGQLALLVAELETQSNALQTWFDQLAEQSGDFGAIPAGELPDLPKGDRTTLRQMTFTLTEEQEAQVKDALARAKDLGEFGDTGNLNTNGNGLARICEIFLASV